MVQCKTTRSAAWLCRIAAAGRVTITFRGLDAAGCQCVAAVALGVILSSRKGETLSEAKLHAHGIGHGCIRGGGAVDRATDVPVCRSASLRIAVCMSKEAITRSNPGSSTHCQTQPEV